MASQPNERPVGQMAAVREYSSCSSPSPSTTFFIPPPPKPVSYECTCRNESLERTASMLDLPLLLIKLPESSTPPPPAIVCTHRRLKGEFFRLSLKFDMKPRSDYASFASRPETSPTKREEYNAWALTKTREQNHLQRSSPPLQPGEQNFPGKLPSFDEFVQTTIERTPPHTPSRRNDSTENSPHVRPQFDDVAWSENKRRRVDTLGDIYARPSNAAEYPPADPRRMSSAIDPALYHAEPARTRQQSAGPSHHRPSLPYPPPASASQHARHQSQPVAQGHPPYEQPAMHAQRMVAQSSYGQPGPQSAMMYERRPSYYHEPQMQQHTYPYDDRREPVYYANQQYANPPAGYEQGYYDVRFQQHVGVDHNAFNRKRRGNLPKEATNLLKDWFNANRQSPYPSEDQKLELCRATALSLNQVSNWFINARRRAPQKEQREREANNGTEQ